MFFLSLLEHQLKMICICLNKGLLNIFKSTVNGTNHKAQSLKILICLLEGEKTYPAKQQHYFFVKFNEYLNFDEYKQCAISMLDRYSVQEYSPHFQFLTSPLFYMERKFIEELSGHLILQGPECLKSPSCQQKNYLHLQEGKSGTSVVKFLQN